MTLYFQSERDVLRFVRPRVSPGQVGAVAFAVWKQARNNRNAFKEYMIPREEAVRVMNGAIKALSV